jgi:hypothetical protein
MTRMNATQMRELATLVKKARQAEKRMLSQQEEKIRAKTAADNERRAQIWRSLYLLAMDGHYGAKLHEFNEEDILYFKSIGFEVSKSYDIDEENLSPLEIEYNNLITLVDDLHTKIEDIELRIDLKNSSEHGFNLAPIEAWIDRNSHTAYGCNFERWFGDDLNTVTIESPEALEELRARAVIEKENSRIQDRIDALQSLLDAIERAFDTKNFDTNFDEDSSTIDELRLEIQEARIRIREIDDSGAEYLGNPEVSYAYVIRWDDFLESPLSSSIEEFSYSSLRWFSSTVGQSVMQALDFDIRIIAERGDRQVKLDCNMGSGRVEVRHEDGSFSGTFPSWYDFCSSLTLRGYQVVEKNTRASRSVIVRW